MTTIQEQLKALKEQEKLLKMQLKNSEKDKKKEYKKECGDETFAEWIVAN